MASSMLPFLAITAINQHNIINQQRMQISSLQSKSRRMSSSSSTYRSKPKLPEKMSAILEKADDRSKGVSYFDLLVVRAIHSNEKAQSVIATINDKYNEINKTNAERVRAELIANADKSQQLYDKAKSQLEKVKESGFTLNYPRAGWGSTSDSVNIIVPSENEKKGYTGKYVTFPSKYNGIKLSADMFKDGKDPYNANLEKFLKENPNVEQNLQNAKENYDKLNRNKIALLFSSKRREARQQAEDEVNKWQDTANIKAGVQKNADFYNNLSKEQKASLVDFLNSVDEIKQAALEADKFLDAQRLIEKNNSMACPLKNIREYHAAVVKEAIEGLSKSDKAALTQFENKAVTKLISLSDEQAVEILKNSPTTESSFEIDGNKIDTSILFEISNHCHEKIEALNPTKTAENQATKVSDNQKQ